MLGTSVFNFAFSYASLWLLVITLWGAIPFLWIGGEKPNAQFLQPDEGLLVKGYRIILAIGLNVCLLGLFAIQHSGLASARFKSYMTGKGWDILHRPVYILTTAIALQGFTRYWQWIPEISLWQFNVEYGTSKWWSFFMIHFLAWVIMYGGCITMDFSELVGLKQVYYHSCELDNPLHLKSPDLQILFQHMRHPCLSLCVILWCHPYMTLGRLMLSLVFPTYMTMRFAVDINDYCYQKRQFQAKLNKLHAH